MPPSLLVCTHHQLLDESCLHPVLRIVYTGSPLPSPCPHSNNLVSHLLESHVFVQCNFRFQLIHSTRLCSHISKALNFSPQPCIYLPFSHPSRRTVRNLLILLIVYQLLRSQLSAPPIALRLSPSILARYVKCSASSARTPPTSTSTHTIVFLALNCQPNFSFSWFTLFTIVCRPSSFHAISTVPSAYIYCLFSSC